MAAAYRKGNMRLVRRALLVIGPLILLSGISAAAPLCGPDLPGRGKWYMGFETNIVFDRDMKKGLGEAESNQYFYNISYGIYDWFSFDGKLGMGDTEFDTIEAGRMDLDLGFAGAYGARFKVYDNREKRLRGVLGFQHISVHPSKEETAGVKYSSIWDEWQISLLLSKEFGKIEPYVGVKASQLYIIRKDNLQDDWSWNGSGDHLGIILGSKAELPGNWYLVLEGRFVDETAFSTVVSHKL